MVCTHGYQRQVVCRRVSSWPTCNGGWITGIKSLRTSEENSSMHGGLWSWGSTIASMCRIFLTPISRMWIGVPSRFICTKMSSLVFAPESTFLVFEWIFLLFDPAFIPIYQNGVGCGVFIRSKAATLKMAVDGYVNDYGYLLSNPVFIHQKLFIEWLF